jgi:hypothetical protein
MCPPPADPIRPIGPVAGDVYVERSAFAERVARRNHRGRDEEQPAGDHQPEADEDDDEPPVPEAWFRTVAPLKAAGGYDDHGRTATSDADDASRAHVDKTA